MEEWIPHFGAYVLLKKRGAKHFSIYTPTRTLNPKPEITLNPIFHISSLGDPWVPKLHYVEILPYTLFCFASPSLSTNSQQDNVWSLMCGLFWASWCFLGGAFRKQQARRFQRIAGRMWRICKDSFRNSQLFRN